MKTIPYIDIRDGGPLKLLETHRDQAIALIEASRDTLGMASRAVSLPLLMLGDDVAHRWLKKSNNPYREEIEAIARQLNVKGVFALNMCYEWGCTSSVYANGDSPTLARVLDWPFPQMGENIVVAHQKGPAGDFYNVTWPGITGMFTGMAKSRFAIALNQAPMRKHGLGFVGDWAAGRSTTWQSTHAAPAHLLRQVFEHARTYDEACEMLAKTPVALPVIFIVSGLHNDQGCVIERTEDDHAIRTISADRVCASNQFETRLNQQGKGWRPREIDSEGRMKKAASIPLSDVNDSFAWFVAPVANSHSRLALMADAAKGTLRVMGTYGAQPVTTVFSLT
jgi:hypothetical protein